MTSRANPYASLGLVKPLILKGIVIPAAAAKRRRAGIYSAPTVKADSGRVRCAALRDDTVCI